MSVAVPVAQAPEIVAHRIELAMQILELGAWVFPLAHDSKQPWLPKTKGGKGFLDAKADPEMARTFLSNPGQLNYGVVFPEGSDVLVLDLDGGDGKGPGWKAEWQALYDRYGPPGLTFIVRTPSGGRHVYYRWRTDLYGPMPAGDEMLGWTVRKPWKGYLVGPGSIIGPESYEPVGAPAIADLPEAWARAALAEKVKSHDAIEVKPGSPLEVKAGHRHNYLRDQARHLVGVGLTGDALFAAVMDLNRQLTEPKTEDEVRRAIGEVETKFQRDPVAAPQRARVVGEGIDAADLIDLTLDPLRWIVPDLLPEGTTIIAAEPKVGKSCLVYQIAVEASIGGDLLGRRVTPGSVLYLALEDGQRRGRDRLLAALAGRTMPRGRLEVRWSANLIGQGLEEDIERWLDDHPDAVMVAIDTLGKIRPAGTGKRGAYEVDVEALAGLQNLFRDRPVGLAIVHHARKATSDDFLATVSGTYGITGSADTIVVIRRKRLEKFGTVYVTGRDIADAEISVEFDQLTWRAAPGALSAASFERTEVYGVIQRRGPVFAKSIADEIGKERSNVQHLIDGLVAVGAVMRTNGGYAVSRVDLDPPHIPPNSVHYESERSDWGHVRAQDVTVDCRDYPAHQLNHRRTPAGWLCPICHPEDAA